LKAAEIVAHLVVAHLVAFPTIVFYLFEAGRAPSFMNNSKEDGNDDEKLPRNTFCSVSDRIRIQRSRAIDHDAVVFG
jgi:hypothetical protein